MVFCRLVFFPLFGIGFELDAHYCDIANERIQKALAEKAVGE